VFSIKKIGREDRAGVFSKIVAQMPCTNVPISAVSISSSAVSFSADEADTDNKISTRNGDMRQRPSPKTENAATTQYSRGFFAGAGLLP